MRILISDNAARNVKIQGRIDNMANYVTTLQIVHPPMQLHLGLKNKTVSAKSESDSVMLQLLTHYTVDLFFDG